MTTRRRDGALAVGTLAVLVAAGTWTAGTAAFVRPVAVVVGVAGALAIEAVFLRYPSQSLALWERPRVVAASVGVVLVLGGVAIWYVPWVLGALCWGLATYLCLLACVLAGVGNPLAAVVPPARRE